MSTKNEKNKKKTNRFALVVTKLLLRLIVLRSIAVILGRAKKSLVPVRDR
jgi:hypothetical protein